MNLADTHRYNALLEERSRVLNELDNLRKADRLEWKKTTIGKFYKMNHDTSNAYTSYVSIAGVDRFGLLVGSSFSIYDNGDVLFSRPGTTTEINERLVDSAFVISREEYNKVYNSIVVKVKRKYNV